MKDASIDCVQAARGFAFICQAARACPSNPGEQALGGVVGAAIEDANGVAGVGVEDEINIKDRAAFVDVR